MLTLEPGNRILQDTVGDKIIAYHDEKRKKEPCDVFLCDFDDVTYHVTIHPDARNILNLSMGMPCYQQIKDLGAEEALKKLYDGFVTDPEQKYDLTLKLDLETLTGPQTELIRKLGHFKDNIIGSVFDRAFESLLSGNPVDPFKFDLRPDTSIYVFPSKERVTVVFHLAFSDKVDLAVARVYLQEFKESRRVLQAAPPVNFDENPPLEMKHFNITEPSKDPQRVGFLSFAILPNHIDKGKKDKVVFAMQSFRDYLMYHIKCSKAFFHSRMRARVVSLLKVLNRAKMDPDESQPKRTITGKTFERKV